MVKKSICVMLDKWLGTVGSMKNAANALKLLVRSVQNIPVKRNGLAEARYEHSLPVLGDEMRRVNDLPVDLVPEFLREHIQDDVKGPASVMGLKILDVL